MKKLNYLDEFITCFPSLVLLAFLVGGPYLVVTGFFLLSNGRANWFDYPLYISSLTAFAIYIGRAFYLFYKNFSWNNYNKKHRK